jgi:hypothetical protein
VSSPRNSRAGARPPGSRRKTSRSLPSKALPLIKYRNNQGISGMLGLGTARFTTTSCTDRVLAGGHRVGTRRYRVLDPEGYKWSFASYRPGTAT